MRTILVQRHADKDPKKNVKDIDIPLSKKGRKQAKQMGNVIKQLGPMPDAIVHSPAQRSADTARIMADALGFNGPLDKNNNVYGADVEELFDIIRSFPESAKVVLLIGHRPAIAQLVSLLTSGSAAADVSHVSAASVAHIRFADKGVQWKKIAPGEGHMKYFVTPDVANTLADAKSSAISL